jgi:hypothetical protein
MTAKRKRSTAKRVTSKRPSQKQVEAKLWQECRRIALKTLKTPSGAINCFTCGSYGISGSNAQLGHFIPRSVGGAFLRYDLRNLRWQCFRCNIHGGGMGAEFYRRLVETEGQDYVDQIFRDKQRIIKARDYYEQLLEEYRLL